MSVPISNSQTGRISLWKPQINTIRWTGTGRGFIFPVIINKNYAYMRFLNRTLEIKKEAFTKKYELAPRPWWN